MLISDITVEVRDDTFNRIGQILPKDLVGFKAVLRFNNVGSWEITLPAGHEVGEILRLPGSGIIVTGPSGVILSGPTMSATNSKTRENPNGEWLITGVDDSVILGERLAYPDPTSADVTAQGTPYDVRHTIASTAMIGYVSDNIGPTGALQRKISNLSVGTDLALGSYVYPAARFDILGELLAGIASIDGLGFDVKQTDGILEFHVYQPVDRSGYIRMDVANNTLSSTQYAYGSHSLSRAIVAGQGEGSNRQFIEVTSTESLSAETLWGRRIETFIDQRNTADADELEQAGQEKLADGGATLTSVDVTPSSDLTMAYGQDWGLGDKVTVVVDEQEVQAIVTTVSMSIESDGIRVGATVGEPTGVDYESKMAKRSTNTAQRVNALERKEVPAITWNDTDGTYEFALKGGNVTLQLGQEQVAYVKNNTGATLPNGSVVYPNGSTGTNKLVALAKADAEVTSSKTFGVLTEDIANGAHGFVTTFGMVHDINTSALTEGAAVYLSPTVAGGMTSTKPSARTRTNLARNVLNGANSSSITTARLTLSLQSGFIRGTVTDANTNAGAQRFASDAPQDIPVIAGTTYTFSAYGRTNAAVGKMFMYINWYTSAGVLISSSFGEEFIVNSSTFTRGSMTATAPANATYLYWAFGLGGGTKAIGNTVDAYGLLIEASPTMGEYFDGSTTTYTGAACSWTGTANASTSIAQINEHMVLIGFCVRSHAVNGSIFVKVQNGFELDELHDVAISAPAAGQLVARNSANTRWENSSPAALTIPTSKGFIGAVDWNTLTTPGTYAIGVSTWTGSTNAPTSAYTYGVLNVIANSTQVTQVYYPHNSIIPQVMRTKYNASDWTAWTAYGTFAGDITVAGETYLNGTEVQGDGKTMLRYSDSWLRINSDNEFTSGIYAGTGILRTDGNFQVGANGATLNVNGTTSITYNARPLRGLVPMIPTSVAVGGGTYTVSNAGKTTFSGNTSIQLNNVFTTEFNSYRIVYRCQGADVNTGFFMRLVDGTTPYSSAVYSGRRLWWGSGGDGGSNDNNLTWWGGIFAHNIHSWAGDIHYPMDAARYTQMHGFGTGYNTGNGAYETHFDTGSCKTTTAFEGLQIILSLGSYTTGELAVYGYEE